MIPQSRSHITMKKKVVHNFPVSFAQVASINNDDLSLPEIIRCKNLTKGCRPRKERRPRRSLSPPHTLPRETTILTAGQGADRLFVILLMVLPPNKNKTNQNKTKILSPAQPPSKFTYLHPCLGVCLFYLVFLTYF